MGCVLTRLEVSGFKNLVGFAAEFGPFTCIAGENGVGKSNVFDAIEFLSLTARSPLAEATQGIRSTAEVRAGLPEHLLTIGLEQPWMDFAAEIVVPSAVTDDFGTQVTPSITFLRYELRLEFESATPTSRQGRFVVARESLRHINRSQAARHMRFPHRANRFRASVVSGRRSGGDFISTEADRITVHQDGGSRGRPRRQLPTRASTTVLSTINTADDPTALAARRELESWQRLALEPNALRAPDQFVDDPSIGGDGRHLAAALRRIAAESPDSADLYARVAARLSSLEGLDVRQVWVDEDDVREVYTVMVRDGDGRELPARSLSEGTLRYLALCVMLEDPRGSGLLTLEEPENGIHPANLPRMVELVGDLAVDPFEAPSPDNPLRQVIVNTHSPGVVQLIDPPNLLLAREVSTTFDGRHVRVLEVEGLRDTWRQRSDGATKADFLPYLVAPTGAQLAIHGVA